MNIANPDNINLATAVWLADDAYDYVPNTISTTTLMRSVRKIILSMRAEKMQRKVSISDLVASSMGTAIHDSIERVWLNKDRVTKALIKLGYSEQEAGRIVINPTKVEKGQFPIYVENRMAKQVKGMTVTGKYDMVMNGQLQDHKSTSVFGYMKGNKVKDFVLQGSIYRWLDPEIITLDTVQINYFFTDWSKLDSMKNPRYPVLRTIDEKYPLMSYEETDKYVNDKIDLIHMHQETPEPLLPECTPDDLWQDESKYKYYSDPTVTDVTKRSTRSFDTLLEANAFKASKHGVGVVLEQQGKVKACNYCNAKEVCSQKVRLELSGQLLTK